MWQEGCGSGSKVQASRGHEASTIALLDCSCLHVGKRLHVEGCPVTACIKVPVEVPGDYSCMNDLGKTRRKTTQLGPAQNF